MKLTTIFLTLALAFSTQAFAKGGGSGITIIPSFGYNALSDKTTPPGTETKTTVTVINGKFGYTLSNGIFLGGIYNSTSITSGSGAGSETTYGGFGASAGWIHSSGFNVIASYLISATGEVNTAPKLEYTGTGISVDVGYSFMFGNWGFGPQLSYASYSFDEVKLGGTVVAGTEQENSNMGLGLQFVVMF